MQTEETLKEELQKSTGKREEVIKKTLSIRSLKRVENRRR